MRGSLTKEEVARWSDRKWRLNNLYTIVDKKAELVPFRLNGPQTTLLDNLHYKNIILKARQLGFSTLFLIMALDCCLFNRNFSAGLVADTEDNAQNLLKRIVLAYNHLPEPLRARVGVSSQNKSEMVFNNGSEVSVGVSLRSSTRNFLHISEYGKICAKYPEKADEVRSGALNTLAPKQLCFIESTAEGIEGDFYTKCQKALAMAAEKRSHGVEDYKMHFFPWFEDGIYRLTERDFGRKFAPDEMDYFMRMGEEHGIELDEGQKRWYAAKAVEQGDSMTREFPSTPAEAFEGSKQGAYFSRDVNALRQRGEVGDFPFEPLTPVNTFWDFGMDDQTGVWFHQELAGRHVFLEYYENSGEGLQFYLNYADRWLNRRRAINGRNLGPHDMKHRSLAASGHTLQRVAFDLGWKFEIVPRTTDKLNTIQNVRNSMPKCRFIMPGAEKGLKHLESYSRDWDSRNGVWRNRPRHDKHSHCADAFMVFADGWFSRNRKESLKRRASMKKRARVYA